MESNEKTVFRKDFKIFDELENDDEDNIVTITENSSMKIGTGSRVWECGLVLAKYFIKQHLRDYSFTKKTILELGSGTGLLAIILAALGNTIYATDIPEVVSFMESNVKENAKVYEKKGKIEVFALDWNFDTTRIREILSGKGVRAVDYIVASDVIFNSSQLEVFSKCLKNVIATLHTLDESAEFPKVYMCHKARNDQIDDSLAETFENLGFYGEQISESELDDQYKSKRIDICYLEYVEKVTTK